MCIKMCVSVKREMQILQVYPQHLLLLLFFIHIFKMAGLQKADVCVFVFI